MDATAGAPGEALPGAAVMPDHRERRAAHERIAAKHGHAVFYVVASEMALAAVKAQDDGSRDFTVTRTWDLEATARAAEACALDLTELEAPDTPALTWRVTRNGNAVTVRVRGAR